MKTRAALAGATALVLVSWAMPAAAQTMSSVAGTYQIVKVDAYGASPRGMMILTRDGHYSINLARDTLPKFASNSRVKGTHDEYKAVVEGSIFHYGTYTIDEGGKAITFNIKASTFPNFDGTTQKRALKVEGDQLTYIPTVASNASAPTPVVWKRMK